MKLRLNPRSLEQLRADETIGLPGLQPDEFSFAKDYSYIEFPCRGGKFKSCLRRISTGDAIHPVWHWNGNSEKPTLTPSIGCDALCGWHGALTDGELVP
jgi:hypothetical protein